MLSHHSFPLYRSVGLVVPAYLCLVSLLATQPISSQSYGTLLPPETPFHLEFRDTGSVKTHAAHASQPHVLLLLFLAAKY